MNVYKTKDIAILPSYATRGSACFDVSAAFQKGDKIKAYNSVNRKIEVLTKDIEGAAAFSASRCNPATARGLSTTDGDGDGDRSEEERRCTDVST